MIKYFFIFTLITTFASTGCAKPNYIDNNNDNSNESKNTTVCAQTFKKSQLCLDWKWELKPTETANGTILFKTYRLNLADKSPVPVDMPRVPHVLLWMPGMGHGSSPTAVSQVDIGTYRANNVFFVMPGQWQIKFQLKDGNQVEDEVIVDIHI